MGFIFMQLTQHYPRYLNQDADLQQQLQIVAGNKRFLYIPAFFLFLRLWGTIQFFYSIGVSKRNLDGCLPKDVHLGFYILGIVQVYM
jgi:hypothetical protein